HFLVRKRPRIHQHLEDIAIEESPRRRLVVRVVVNPRPDHQFIRMHRRTLLPRPRHSGPAADRRLHFLRTHPHRQRKRRRRQHPSLQQIPPPRKPRAFHIHLTQPVLRRRPAEIHIEARGVIILPHRIRRDDPPKTAFVRSRSRKDHHRRFGKRQPRRL